MEWEDSPELAAAVEQAERDEYMERIRAEEHEWEVRQEGQPQPNLSAAVQTLEKLVEKWRDDVETGTAWDDGYSSARTACADELSEALSHLRQREAATMPETIQQPKYPRCPYCHAPDCVEAADMSDPLPAHDAPQVERFELEHDAWLSHAMLIPAREGDFVRYTDYATLEAEKQQLHAAVIAAEEMRAEEMMIAVTALKRAEVAESQLHTLREAVREWKEAHDAEHAAMDSSFSRRDFVGLENATFAAAEKLRALVTPQGET